MQSIAFTSDGRLIAADRGGSICTYRLGSDFPNTAREDALHHADDHWLAHPERIWSLAMLPGEGRFVSAGRDGVIPPLAHHRVEPLGDVAFYVEFHRRAARTP